MKKSQQNLGSMEIFAKNLKKYIDEAKVSQVDVAKAIGVTKGTVCDWVKCRAYPRMDKIQLLAEYFGIQKSDLVDDVKKDEVSEEDQKVLNLFHKVPKEKREFVLSLIQATIDNL